ncbi:hypothetical protein IscW_ISCW009474 [Ixodes scapularis]|uniref:Uncharacterized protein n=1 Tax=Ixodes scapularis TaxID=6945 RepID=B7PYD3_IXOSC|nr:hypothetical protein IscW_ISCW009474 [Ixodes scapularis]|eukprot:XP_002402987.1 hypothetical protein IscW_ISCW009474 [Ixodes scapularis]
MKTQIVPTAPIHDTVPSQSLQSVPTNVSSLQAYMCKTRQVNLLRQTYIVEKLTYKSLCQNTQNKGLSSVWYNTLIRGTNQDRKKKKLFCAHKKIENCLLLLVSFR